MKGNAQRIYMKDNVFDAALDRIRWIFDEFDEVVVNVSGGKDSTVVWELCRIVAKEKGRLPLKTLFADQEAEWQATIDIIQYIWNVRTLSRCGIRCRSSCLTRQVLKSIGFSVGGQKMKIAGCARSGKER